ncbi:hypothetical protein [Aquimarina agarilytica]|uniref:hypothetical protein n=1 Tax=Aquimarina agarilytica TaxID=1087449 RepID=UPI00028805BD|nr:hypothetical protein [Aquimarina agarilytica]
MNTETSKNLKEIILSLIATPKLGEKHLITLYKKDANEIIKTFFHWLTIVSEINNRLAVDNLIFEDNNNAHFTLLKPINTKIGVICTSTLNENNLNYSLKKHIENYNLDFAILLSNQANDIQDNNDISKDNKVLYIDSNWLASIIIDNQKPFFAQLGITNNYEWTPYIKSKKIKTISLQNKNLETTFYSDTYELYKGDIFAVNSHLPLITIPKSFIERYYKSKKATKLQIEKVFKNRSKLINNWESHINNYNHYQIVDQVSLENYIKNPKYLGLSLTKKELQEQIFNLKTLLKYNNYKFLVTTESLDFNFELKNSKVCLKPTLSINSPSIKSFNIVVCTPLIYNEFEKRFWNIYELIGDEFSNKKDLVNYIDNIYCNSLIEHNASIQNEKVNIELFNYNSNKAS